MSLIRDGQRNVIKLHLNYDYGLPTEKFEMEDILKKNIFYNADLEKLSPDYNPSNVLLRMQTRRQTVKDTHFHRSHKNNTSQRKTFKRPKCSYHAMNREISKLRDDFQCMNLKNQIMLKKAIQKLDSLKLKDLPSDDDDESKNIVRPLLNEFKTIATELVLSNDNDFKINDKRNVLKQHNKVINCKKNIKEPLKKVYEPTEDINENIMRIECKHINYEEFSTDRAVQNEVKGEQVTLTNENHNIMYVKNIEHTSTQNNFDNQLDDLQTLLIMMAISPKPDDRDSSNSPESNCYETGQDIIKSPRNGKVNLNALMEEDILIGDFLKVNSIKREIDDREKQILKKYVDKWKLYANKRKTSERQNALNNFFDKLSKKKMNLLTSPERIDKAKLIATDFNRYQHRYKMQKHIIALQKAKLEEQRRIIDELKYNKIIEASKQSVDELKEAVRKTYYDIDRQLKPKVKCLTNELKIPDVEESLVLHCLKMPQFLQRMEKRAREREEKHAIIKERRRQMEEERVRLKQQEELAKATMDKEEKLKRIKELKDKRKKDKVESIRKKQFTERMRALRVMAELHYEKNLMAKYGIRPMRMLIKIKRDNMEKAKAHYKFQLKKNIFLNWMWYTEDMWYERNFKAEDFCRKKMLSKSFEALKKNYNGFVIKKQVAEDYHDLYVTQLVFRKFREAIRIVQIEDALKCQTATLYFQSNLLFKTFTCWRTLPALNALKREQEVRKARWRKKVLQVVPDYTPPED